MKILKKAGHFFINPNIQFGIIDLPYQKSLWKSQIKTSVGLNWWKQVSYTLSFDIQTLES